MIYRLLSVRCAVAALVLGAFIFTAPAAAKKPMKGSRGVAVSVVQQGYCSALAPRGWTIQTNQQGSAVDLTSPDAGMYSGWGVTSVNRAMQPYYGNMYGDPETSMRYPRCRWWRLRGVRRTDRCTADGCGSSTRSTGSRAIGNMLPCFLIASSKPDQ